MANNLPSDDHVVVDAPKLNAQYRIDSLLGEGGMGRVYRAEHQLTGQVVAIKALREELSQDNTFRTRFLIEAKVLSKLDHPSITHLLNFIAEEDGRLFLVMQYVAGPTLDDLLIQLGPLPPAVAMTVFHEILAAFDYAHTQGIIHRDIKPANIVLPPTGGVKVMDFGIARMEHQIKLTTTGASLGSPAYMAPEQVTGGPLDSRCDIYALGCMLFEITTGDIPFNGETGYSVMKAHVEDRPPDPRDLVSMPDPIADAILWALKKNPKERPARASILSDALPSAEYLGGSNAASWRFVCGDHRSTAVANASLSGPTLADSDDAPGLTPSESAVASVQPGADGEAASDWTIQTGGAVNPPLIQGKPRAIEPPRDSESPPLYGPGDPPRSSPLAGLVLLGAIVLMLAVGLYRWRVQHPLPEPVADTTELAPSPKFSTLVPRVVMGVEMTAVKGGEDLRDFYVTRTEVTLRQYQDYLRACGPGTACGPTHSPAALLAPLEEKRQVLDHPTGSVSNRDAERYCRWLGGRLPSSKEWTRMASGGDGRMFPWGNDERGGEALWLAEPQGQGAAAFYKQLNQRPAQLATISVYDEIYYRDVGPFGVMGLGGNLSEWLSDPDPHDSELRQVAGGSWSSFDIGHEARATDRIAKGVDTRSASIGFRCVAAVPTVLEVGKPTHYHAIKQTGILRVGAEEECPPMYWSEDGKPVGFEYEMMKELARAMEVRLKVVPGMYPDLPARLRSGHFDLIVSAYTPDSSIRGIDWSVPYFEYGLSLVVRKGSGIRTILDLKGKLVGHYNDPATANDVAAIAPHAKKIVVYERRYLEALEAGQIDAFLYDFPFLQAELKRFTDNLQIVQYGLTESTYNVGLPEGEWTLTKEVNSAVARWMDSPAYRETVRRYLGGATPLASIPRGVRTTRVKPGDTLKTLARRELGNESRWKDIWALNRSRLGNKHLIFAGTPIILPQR